MNKGTAYFDICSLRTHEGDDVVEVSWGEVAADKKKEQARLDHERRSTGSRELQRALQERSLLQALVDGRLHEELLALVMAELASGSLRELHIANEKDMKRTLCAILGSSKLARQLHCRLQTALLENVAIRADVTFQRQGTLVGAQIPALTVAMEARVRSFVLDLNTPVSVRYPTGLHRATAGLQSLAGQLPRLHTFTIRLNLPDVRCRRGDTVTLNQPCYTGYSQTRTYRSAVEKLVEAAQLLKPSVKLVLCMHLEEAAVYAETPIDERASSEIVGALLRADRVCTANPGRW